MKLGLAALVLVLISFSTEARRPAVEDFVGVEQETPDITPAGTETLFNFSQDVKDFKNQQTQPVVNYKKLETLGSALPSQGFSFSVWFAVGFVLALPMITWGAMASHLKKRQAGLDASLPHNVTELAARRAEKQAASEDELKKAS